MSKTYLRALMTFVIGIFPVVVRRRGTWFAAISVAQRATATGGEPSASVCDWKAVAPWLMKSAINVI
jgi:hypothetical protein